MEGLLLDQTMLSTVEILLKAYAIKRSKRYYLHKGLCTSASNARDAFESPEDNMSYTYSASQQVDVDLTMVAPVYRISSFKRFDD